MPRPRDYNFQVGNDPDSKSSNSFGNYNKETYKFHYVMCETMVFGSLILVQHPSSVVVHCSHNSFSSCSADAKRISIVEKLFLYYSR